MKKGFRQKIFAAFLTILLAGCQMAPANLPKEHEKQLVSPENSQQYPFAMEHPDIDSEPIAGGGSIEASISDMAVISAPKEVKAVWISYLEFEQILKNKTESQFTKSIKSMLDTSKSFGLNTVFVQVRPFSDALYKSGYFPWSHTITGTEGKNPGFDPLKIMVTEAKARGLRIEAWINPYRIRPADRKQALAKNSYARKWLDDETGDVISYKGVLSYNPASAKAQTLIVKGAVEICQNYDVDGIHIDDYFYPFTDKAFDIDSYNSYKSGGGRLSQEDWRRANVESLLKKMYSAIKKVNKKLVFGISPAASIYDNYHVHYLDAKKITATKGYCDYICPQIYFGFEHKTRPFTETLSEWSTIVKNSDVKLYVGLAAYKIGTVDSWAGDGKNEWRNSTTMLKRMTLTSRKANNYAGIVIYRYDSLFNPEADVKSAVQKEASNLKEVLK